MDELNEGQVSIAAIDTKIPSDQNIEDLHSEESGESGVVLKEKPKSDKPIRPFPQFSIQEAMEIPKAIGTQNAGNPWAVEHIASALNTAKGTTRFFYLTSASRDYGFTTGTSKAKMIELTAQGRKLVFQQQKMMKRRPWWKPSIILIFSRKYMNIITKVPFLKTNTFAIP